MKGDLEALLSQFEHQALYFDQHTPAHLHPGRSARAVMDGATVARFGQLHPELASARKLRQPVYVAEILVDRLFQRELRQPNYRPVPRFPAVERDFSLCSTRALSSSEFSRPSRRCRFQSCGNSSRRRFCAAGRRERRKLPGRQVRDAAAGALSIGRAYAA